MKNTFKTILRILLVLSCSQAWGAEAAPKKTGVDAFVATTGATESTDPCKVCSNKDTIGTENVRCSKCNTLSHASCIVTKVLEHLLDLVKNLPGDPLEIGKIKKGVLTKKQMFTIINFLPTVQNRDGFVLDTVLASQTTQPFVWPCCGAIAPTRDLIMWAHLYWMNESRYDAQLDKTGESNALTQTALTKK